jgi:hypothetical protein
VPSAACWRTTGVMNNNSGHRPCKFLMELIFRDPTAALCVCTKLRKATAGWGAALMVLAVRIWLPPCVRTLRTPLFACCCSRYMPCALAFSLVDRQGSRRSSGSAYGRDATPVPAAGGLSARRGVDRPTSAVRSIPVDPRPPRTRHGLQFFSTKARTSGNQTDAPMYAKLCPSLLEWP